MFDPSPTNASFSSVLPARILLQARILSLGFLLGWGLAILNVPTFTMAEGLSRPEEFFEEKIRPLLIDHCQACHDASLHESDLRLDSRDGILQGGLSGAAAIAGNPGQSLLLRAVLGTHGVERMPPDEPLEEDQISLLRRWVKMGLPWTAQDVPAPIALGDQKAINRIAQSHWAFQPISHPRPPRVPSHSNGPAEATSANAPSSVTQPPTDWNRNPIDAFVLQRLRENKLSPSPPATRQELLRRLSFDLIGLPPTQDQVRTFVDDPRSDATLIEETVDRLLASEHHGERWARYWLDLARYADTRDWQAQAELRYPYAYTYRDYVISSLNQNKPYNEFIQEQIAADFYVNQPDAPELAALGFLTLGPQFRNDRLEQVADKIDVVGRGLMGITISCARCHDHKYDPIPIEDYYSLYGVFASCSTPDAYPTIDVGHVDEALLADFEVAVRRKQRDLQQYKMGLRRDAILDLQKRVTTYLDAFIVMGIDKKKEIRGIKSQFKILETAMTPLNQELLNRLRRNQDQNDPVLGPWHDALSISGTVFEEKAAEFLKRWKSDPSLNTLVVKALSDAVPRSQSEVVAAYGDLIDGILQKSQAGDSRQNEVEKTNPPLGGRLDRDEQAIRLAILGPDGWFDFDPEVVASASRLLGSGRKALGDLEKAITEVESTHPGAPPRAMTLEENDKPVTPFVLLRGEAARKGDRVPRQFISILSPKRRKPFVDGSGRRELAEAITSPSNPLTTRVFINRVWSKYFGKGLVASLDDFGLRSEPPSHPELLDFLASEFIANDWSMKWLHKVIVTSQAYAQSSRFREDAVQSDPDNRWLWRQSRRRLDFEAMRDSILCASGSLDRAVGGKSVKLSDEPFTTRRSVYAYVDRIELDPILRTFDFASPSASAASRPETTIPQQALFGMNHPFVAEQARLIAERAESNISRSATTDIPHDRDRLATNKKLVESLYQRVFARHPLDDEADLAIQFLTNASQQNDAGRGPTWQYGFGTLDQQTDDRNADDFFQPLPYWTGQFYQTSETFPDPDGKHLRLTATGGHTGKDNDHATVRRWIAPDSGVVNVNGTIKHTRDNSDGVIAAVRSAGVYETFKVNQSESKTLVKQIKVQAGDVIDFIVAPGKTSASDSYTWNSLVFGVRGNLAGKSWRSNTEFTSPPPPALTPTAQLAQALLLTNEFLYLD